MAITYSSSVKNTRLGAVVTAIGSTGVLEIGTAGMVDVLVRFTLNSVAGTVASGVLTFSGTPKSAAALLTGTAAAARIRTAAGGTDVVSGLTVGTSGADVLISNTSISAGSQVTLSAATITHT